jgi:hypothetical protein
MRLSVTVTGVRALADRSGHAAAPTASSPRISCLKHSRAAAKINCSGGPTTAGKLCCAVLCCPCVCCPCVMPSRG